VSEQRPDDERYPLVPSAPGWDERSASTVRLQRIATVLFALLGAGAVLLMAWRAMS
jgi:hypothetical protein